MGTGRPAGRAEGKEEGVRLKKLKAPHHLRQQLGGVFFLALIVFPRRGTTPWELRWVMPAGTLLFLLGMIGRVWASGYLIKNDALTTSGPYGYVRNPIYVSNMILGLGLVLLSGHFWTLVVLAALYAICYVPGMRVEDENLRQRYGAALDAYANAVPLIVPRVRCASGFGGGNWTLAAYLQNRETYVTAGLILGLIAVLWMRLSATCAGLYFTGCIF